MEFEHVDLAILLAYRMMDAWDVRLTMIAGVEDASEKEKAGGSGARVASVPPQS